MSNANLEEMAWIEERTRHNTVRSAWDHLTEQAEVVLSETGGYPDANMCSTMEELTGKKPFPNLNATAIVLLIQSTKRSLKTNLELWRRRHLWLKPELWFTAHQHMTR